MSPEPSCFRFLAPAVVSTSGIERHLQDELETLLATLVRQPSLTCTVYINAYQLRFLEQESSNALVHLIELSQEGRLELLSSFYSEPLLRISSLGDLENELQNYLALLGAGKSGPGFYLGWEYPSHEILELVSSWGYSYVLTKPSESPGIYSYQELLVVVPTINWVAQAGGKDCSWTTLSTWVIDNANSAHDWLAYHAKLRPGEYRDQSTSTRAKRYLELCSRLAPLINIYHNQPQLISKSDRLDRAMLVARSLAWHGFYCDSLNVLDFEHLLISAEVDLDTVLNPNVAPNIGWVGLEARAIDQSSQEELVVDTQLLRTYFKPANDIFPTEIHYKPTKRNLLNTEIALSIAPTASGVGFKTLIHTKDLLTLAATPTQGLPELACKYSFKAGFGSYRHNATTGFSVEYWFDTNNSNEIFEIALPLRVKFNITSLRGLLCVGATDTKLYPATDPATWDSSIPGFEAGVYGIRVNETDGDLAYEIRSAKPLLKVASKPVGSDTILVTLQSSVDFLISQDRANTLFVSIF